MQGVLVNLNVTAFPNYRYSAVLDSGSVRAVAPVAPSLPVAPIRPVAATSTGPGNPPAWLGQTVAHEEAEKQVARKLQGGGQTSSPLLPVPTTSNSVARPDGRPRRCCRQSCRWRLLWKLSVKSIAGGPTTATISNITTMPTRKLFHRS